MRKWKLTIPLLLVVLACVASGQQEQRSVLLSAHEVKAVSDRYADERSEKYDGTWEPTKADLDGLESNLSQVSAMKIVGWDSKIHIEHPERYFRQYVAVKVSGQNRIFINAFREPEPPPPDWRDRLWLVDDGALGYWQALYDPYTKKFSNLRINPRA
jgi:hypothetical protein